MKILKKQKKKILRHYKNHLKFLLFSKIVIILIKNKL